MPEGLVDTLAQTELPVEPRIHGVTVASVVSNLDSEGQGRVQIRLPWRSDILPWARVATLMAGRSQGTYFIPQVDDEVLVAFNQGDILETYIIGSLWNGLDRPPTSIPTDAITKRIIRTPVGHELMFDDAQQTISITSSTEQKITIDPKKIEISTAEGTATISCDTAGNVSIQAAKSIELKAPTITLDGGKVDIKSSARTTINGGQSCDIKASMIRIN